MSASDQERWDGKYAKLSTPEKLTPDEWLTIGVHEQQPGRALDLACGLGHNAIWLAQNGWTVDAVDISPTGLQLAKQFAGRLSCPPIEWIAADLDEFTPEPAAYDLVIVFRFLDRQKLPSIIPTALRPGGRLIYETFLRSQLGRADSHIRNPAFTLDSDELPRLYKRLTVIDYRETELPDRTVGQLLSEKPSNA